MPLSPLASRCRVMCCPNPPKWPTSQVITYAGKKPPSLRHKQSMLSTMVLNAAEPFPGCPRANRQRTALSVADCPDPAKWPTFPAIPIPPPITERWPTLRIVSARQHHPFRHPCHASLNTPPAQRTNADVASFVQSGLLLQLSLYPPPSSGRVDARSAAEWG